MKRTILIISALLLAFCLGMAAQNAIKPTPTPLKRVTGLGGVFFKCKDTKTLKAWYKEHLGLMTDQYGTVFEWRQAGDSTQKGFTVWSPFAEKTKYFDPSTKDFMINYRVADLKALLVALKAENVTILDTMETYSYGKFVHIIDPEGNKIELWEPIDDEFEKIGNKNAVTK